MSDPTRAFFQEVIPSSLTLSERARAAFPTTYFVKTRVSKPLVAKKSKDLLVKHSKAALRQDAAVCVPARTAAFRMSTR